MSKLKKIGNYHRSQAILTPGHRETEDLMTIEDEVKSMTYISNITNEDEIIDPEKLCDQRLEIPGDSSCTSHKSNVTEMSYPSIPSNKYSISVTSMESSVIEGLGPTSQYMIELFRKGIDIHNEEDRRYLTQRLQSSNIGLERASIEAYVRIFETKQCEYCSYSCKDRDSIKRHISNVHLKEKPFPCDECDASFGRKDKLKRHKQCLHSDERPYSCEFCDYSCKRQDKLRLHTQRMHYKNLYQIQKPCFKSRRKTTPLPAVTSSQSNLSKSVMLNTTL